MKTTQLITLGALIGTCSFASAEAPKPDGPRPERPMHRTPPEILKQFDKDGDGKLSPDEAKAAREARQAEMIKKFDKDGDGTLSEDERKAMHAEMEARQKAILEKYDVNKNGKLDPEEIKAARDAGEKFLPMMGHGRGGPGGPVRPAGPRIVEDGKRAPQPDGGAEGPRPAPPVE